MKRATRRQTSTRAKEESGALSKGPSNNKNQSKNATISKKRKKEGVEDEQPKLGKCR